MSTPHWNIGVAGQITRDTEHDAPTQVVSGAIPKIAPPVVPELTTRGNLGGPIPDHSESWGHYFSPEGGGTGTTPPFIPVDPKAVHRMVSDPQNMVTGNTHDGWRTLFQLTTGPMRNGSGNNSTYSL